MAKQAARWRDMELLVEERVAAALRLPLAGWNENATFFRTSMDHIDEAQHEYFQALDTAVFETEHDSATAISYSPGDCASIAARG